MNLDQALRLRALGLNIIPLDGKRPSVALPKGDDGKPKWKSFQTERATEADLHTWFGNGAKRNAGIPLGPVSRVVVIDSDSPEAETWCATNLPDTPMMTRTARGFHRYYLRPLNLLEIPAFIRVNDLAIEVRREGQYVVAPGSVHPGDREKGIAPGYIYTEVRPWPASLDDLPTLPMDIVTGSGGQAPATKPLPRNVNDGSRNTTLFCEGCRLRRLGFDEIEILAALLAVNLHRCHPPLDSGEVEGIARSCARYEPAADRFPTTETGDAESFCCVQRRHGSLRPSSRALVTVRQACLGAANQRRSRAARAGCRACAPDRSH